MSYILFSTRLNLPLARIDAPYETATAAEGELIIPCTPDADPNDIEHWRAEAAKPPALPTPEELLATAKAQTLSAINTAAEEALNILTETYPLSEQLSFDKQEMEARAYLADTTVSTPLLSALAQYRGITLTDLVQRVIMKADTFASLSGCIIGQRQALEDALVLAKTVEEVKALSVVISFPKDTIPDTPATSVPDADETLTQ